LKLIGLVNDENVEAIDSVVEKERQKGKTSIADRHLLIKNQYIA